MNPKGAARLPPAAGGMQVNCCKNPACRQFAVRPDPESEAKPPPRHGIGPSAFYDGSYLIDASKTNKPSLECLSCSENIPLKSNTAVQAEVLRLRRREAGSRKGGGGKKEGCPKDSCRNHGLPDGQEPGPYRPRSRYLKFGVSQGKQRLQCRACGSTWSPGGNPRGRPRRPLKKEERKVFRGLISHTPYARMSGLLEVSLSRLHQLIGRFEEEALEAQAALEEGLPEALRGRRLTLSTDRQVYPVNWSEREDRRNIVLHSVVTADQGTGYVLCAHVNYDPDVEPGRLALAAEQTGDYAKHPAYRAEARVWLPGELAGEGKPVVGATARASSEQRYREASARADVEQPETSGREPSKGAVVREGITLYAHFRLLRERVEHARHVTHCFEQESAMRAACLTAFDDRVLDGRCEAFYVRIDKGFTAKRKQEMAGASRALLRAVQAEHNCDGLEARRLLVRAALGTQRLAERGPWRDRWLRHPCPTAFEPDKEVCRLTRRPGEGPEKENPAAVHGYAFASLHAVDRFFLQVRYKVNTLDRHRQTASFGRAWNVYHPYNPGRVPALLSIYRLWHNWSLAGKDGNTPAMRVGLAVRPLNPETLLERGLQAALEEVRTPQQPEPAARPQPRPQPPEIKRQPETERGTDTSVDFGPGGF